MKMLFFDFKEGEKSFFEENELRDFEVEFFENPVGWDTNLTDEQLRDTDALCVSEVSELNEEVMRRFRNLRIVSVRHSEYKNVDMDYCRNKRIAVFHVPAETLPDKILETTFNNIRDYCKGMHTNQVY